MNGRGKSDKSIVPKKLPNKDGFESSAEEVEERDLARENSVLAKQDSDTVPIRPAKCANRVRQAVENDQSLCV